MAGILPWGMRGRLFHPVDLVGQVDFTQLGEKSVRPVSTFTIDPTQGSASHNRFLTFLLRNRALVIARLKEQPTLFSEIVTGTDFVIEDPETPADFFGVYSAPEQLDGEGFTIKVCLTGKTFNANVGGTWFSGTDPMMFLEENL